MAKKKAVKKKVSGAAGSQPEPEPEVGDDDQSYGKVYEGFSEFFDNSGDSDNLFEVTLKDGDEDGKDVALIVAAATEHKANLAVAEHLIQTTKKVTQKDMMSAMRDELDRQKNGG